MFAVNLVRRARQPHRLLLAPEPRPLRWPPACNSLHPGTSLTGPRPTN